MPEWPNHGVEEDVRQGVQPAILRRDEIAKEDTPVINKIKHVATRETATQRAELMMQEK